MDGRNLSSSIILKWTPEISLAGIANTIPVFIKKVLMATDYEFYGEFCINAVYEMKNFNNMLVSNFHCKIDTYRDDKKVPLFYGKIVFWSSLFAITDIQINKERKAIRIHFYSNDQQEQMRLVLDNVLYFKETLIKKMSNLKTEIEINKLIKGKTMENKITMQDINNMTLEQIEEGVKYFGKKIQNNEVNFYIVDTFNYLCSKAIEYYSKIDPNKQLEYIMKMKNILQNPKVKEILTLIREKQKKSMENNK